VTASAITKYELAWENQNGEVSAWVECTVLSAESHTANQVLKSAGGNWNDDNLTTGVNVRSGVAFGISLSGACAVPVPANVRLGSSVSSGSGVCRVPTAAQVQAGVAFDANDSVIGTYVSTADYPSESNVRLGVTYDSGAKTGNCRVPAPAYVREGYDYDSLDSVTGTLDVGGDPGATTEDITPASLPTFESANNLIFKQFGKTVRYRRGATYYTLTAIRNRIISAEVSADGVFHADADCSFDVRASVLGMTPKPQDEIWDGTEQFTYVHHELDCEGLTYRVFVRRVDK
jgi:hypothetical protein